MKRRFSLYEFNGYLVPGALLLVGMAMLFPEARGILVQGAKDFGLGHLGLVILVAFVFGHLIASFGAAVSSMWWCAWGGMPTQWVVLPGWRQARVINANQLHALVKAAKSHLGIDAPPLAPAHRRDWQRLAHQMRSMVLAARQPNMIEVQGANYALARNCVAAFVVIVTVGAVASWLHYQVSSWTLGICTIGALASLFNMHRFGEWYAREVFVQFLALASRPERPRRVSVARAATG